MAPSFLGGFIAGRFKPAAAQHIGLTLVAAAGAGLAFASTAGILGLYIGRVSSAASEWASPPPAA